MENDVDHNMHCYLIAILWLIGSSVYELLNQPKATESTAIDKILNLCSQGVTDHTGEIEDGRW